MSVSMLGDGVFWVALAWQVYQLSDAPTALSVVGIAWTLPMVVFLLVAGIVTDRIQRRKVTILADVIRGIAVVTMGILSVTGTVELWHLVLLSGLFGVGDAFFGPAFGAIVPDIVPPGLIVEANSLDRFVRPLTFMMLGPAVGGLTIDAFGVGQAFVLDAITFAFSEAMLLKMSSRPVEKKEAISWRSAVRELQEGLRYARSQPWLWATLMAAGLTLLAIIGPLEVVLPHLIKYQLGGNAGDLGIIYALGGVGSIVGAIFLSQRGIPRRHITVMYVQWAIEDIGIAAYAFAGSSDTRWRSAFLPVGYRRRQWSSGAH
jgi:MFS family permease